MTFHIRLINTCLWNLYGFSSLSKEKFVEGEEKNDTMLWCINCTEDASLFDSVVSLAQPNSGSVRRSVAYNPLGLSRFQGNSKISRCSSGDAWVNLERTHSSSRRTPVVEMAVQSAAAKP